MKTITALVDRVWVPIFVGSIDQGRFLLKGEFFDVPNAVWDLQVLAQQMVTDGLIS